MKRGVLLVALLALPSVLAAGSSQGLLLALLIAGIVVLAFVAFLLFVFFSKSRYHPISMQQLIEKYKMIAPDGDFYRLVLFVKDAHLYEHSFSEIRTALTALGWDVALVNKALNEIRIDEFIVDALDEGRNKIQIQEALLQAGWSSDQVKGAFERSMLIEKE